MQLKLMSPMTDQTPKASAEQSIILYQFFRKIEDYCKKLIQEQEYP